MSLYLSYLNKKFSIPNIWQIADLPIEKMDDEDYLNMLAGDIKLMYASQPKDVETLEAVVNTTNRIFDRLNKLEAMKKASNDDSSQNRI